jgi:uncharacterized membrane protein
MLPDDLFYNFFCSTGGYTIESTTVFTLILLFFVYIIFEILKLLKIRIDGRLAVAISPFIPLGSSIRVLKDSGVLTSCLFQTPGIYFLTFGLTFSTLFASKVLERKKGIPYYKLTFIIGLIFLGPILGFLDYRNFIGVSYVLLFFLPWLIFLRFLPWLKENKIITSIHVFDGTVTSVSMSFFGYYEQHVLPRYFIYLLRTPFSFVFLKFIVVVLVLSILDKYSGDKEFKNYIKLIIGILGAATGIRSFLRLFGLT